MLCNHVINEFLMDYLDGSLPEGERSTFEAHLSVCRNCRVYIDTYRQTVAAAKSCMGCAQNDAPPPPQPPEDLVKAILASIPKKKV